MFIPDASLPPIRTVRKDHFFLYSTVSGISVIPLTGFGGAWMSEVLGKDSNVHVTRDAAACFMIELYNEEPSPTLD